MNLNWNPEPDDIKKALKFNPENSHYYYKQALHCSMLAADASMLKKAAAIQETGSLNKLNDKEYRNQAIESLIKALQLNPASATCWLSLGEEFRLSSYDAYKYLNYFLPKADKCYDMAISCAPENYHVLFNGGWYWAWRARLLPESKENPPLNREYGIKKFQSLFNKSLTLNPALWKKAVDRVDLYFQDDTIILGIAPEDNQDLRHHILKYIVAKSG
jgi:tetratricopeptide (TPR) repeat protein